jgi:hypothetical protein
MTARDPAIEPISTGPPAFVERTSGKSRATAARECLEATMAALITIALIVTVAGVLFGIYIRVCLVILREDRLRGSLRLGARNQSAQAARTLMGVSSSKWD